MTTNADNPSVSTPTAPSPTDEAPVAEVAQARQAAVTVARSFVEAFSTRDHEALAATLNYPHVRLANGRFGTVDSAEAFIALSQAGDSRLERERFHHSELRELEPIQTSADKVHLRIINDRVNLDGEVYLSFNTLWIATLQAEHWGIQFRSSYLGVTS